MDFAKPLPQYLQTRFHGWKATDYQKNQAWYKRLVELGQHPRAMVISCCDSRVHVTSVFGAEEGEFFIHRNIANLIPPFRPSGDHHGTSAALEYAVKALKVAHIIVQGHSNCGGVQGCIDMCEKQETDEKDVDFSFVEKWLDILRPGYKSVAHVEDPKEKRTQLEQQGVLISLQNLMTFPFVSDAVNSDELTLHGIWHDIGAGGISVFDSKSDQFHEL